MVGSAAVAGVVGDRRRPAPSRASTCVVGSAGVALSAGVVGSAGIIAGLGNVGCAGCVACIGCVNCKGCVGCIGCSGITGGVGLIGVHAVTTSARAIPNLVVEDAEAAKTFFDGFLGFDVAMDEAGFAMYRSPSNPTAQITTADLNVDGQDRGIKEANVSVEVEDADRAARARRSAAASRSSTR